MEVRAKVLISQLYVALQRMYPQEDDKEWSCNEDLCLSSLYQMSSNTSLHYKFVSHFDLLYEFCIFTIDFVEQNISQHLPNICPETFCPADLVSYAGWSLFCTETGQSESRKHLTKSTYSQAQLSPALDQTESPEACSTPTAGSCPPSGWSFLNMALLNFFGKWKFYGCLQRTIILVGIFLRSQYFGIFLISVCLQRSGIWWSSPWTWTRDWRGDSARLLSVGAICPLPPGENLTARPNFQPLQSIAKLFYLRVSCSTSLTTCGKPLSTRRLTRSPLVCEARRCRSTLTREGTPSRISSTIFGRPGALMSPMHSSKNECYKI